MNAHFRSAHFGSSHYASAHFAGVGEVVEEVVETLKSGLEAIGVTLTEREIMLVVAAFVISQ